MNIAKGEQMCCNIPRHEFKVMWKKNYCFHIPIIEVLRHNWLMMIASEIFWAKTPPKKRNIFLINFLLAHIIHKKFTGMSMLCLGKVTSHFGVCWARNSKMVGKASFRILNPRNYASRIFWGPKKTVNQPVQLWECSCELAEGNDEVEGNLIKWTCHQAENSISTLEDKISI